MAVDSGWIWLDNLYFYPHFLLFNNKVSALKIMSSFARGISGILAGKQKGSAAPTTHQQLSLCIYRISNSILHEVVASKRLFETLQAVHC